MKFEEKIKKIADYHGYDTQSRQLIEEMAELTQAISKYWRKILITGGIESPPDQDHVSPYQCEIYHNLVEELADVAVMIEQISYLLESVDMVDRIMHEKVDREIRRMEQSESLEDAKC